MESKARVINLSNYEDITAYNFSEYYSSGHKWVDFGKYNDYPSFLRNLYLTSPTHQAIVDGSINMATGEGVEVINPEQNPISNKWINDNFSKGVVKLLISDLKLYGYCVVQIYNGSMVKYSEALKYRYDTKDDNGNVNYVWYSNDWDNYTSKGNKPIKLPIYKEGSTESLSICIYQLNKKGFDYYSPVDYNGAINYISLESEISKYHLSNVKNGLFPSFLITFIGAEFSDEQMDKVERQVNKKFGGSSNAGRAIIGFSASKDEATELTTIDQPNLDQTYSFLSEECSKKILIGHGVTSPIIFGIRDTGGGLGNNAEELQNSYYLYYESKLKYYQDYIIEMITKIMNGNLLYAQIEFKSINPFSNREETKMGKIEHMNEINSQDMLYEIDNSAIKTDDIFITEHLFDGRIKNDCLYKFIKSSNINNLINKKFEILTDKGFLFKPSELIKNTSDYYFIEKKYIKK